MLIVSALVVTALLLANTPGLRPRDFLLRRWAEQLPTLSGERLIHRAEEIAAFDADGVPILVRALHADQDEVVHAAGKALTERVARWRLLPVRKSSEYIAVLASALAEDVGHYHPRGHVIAMDLASEALLWPIDRDRVDGLALVENCEKVIRRTRITPPPRETVTAPPVTPLPDIPPTLPATPTTAPATPPLHGGGLPVDVTQLPASLPPLERVTEGDAPKTLVPHQPRQIAEDAALPAVERPGVKTLPYARIGTEVLMSNLSDVEVMRYLHAAHAEEVQAAEDELPRRGFQSQHLHVARQLTHDDPRVRRRLAQQLPRQDAIEPRAWLLELSRDRDLSVRLAAATVMATSRDLTLLKRLQQMALEETDPAMLRIVRQVDPPTSDASRY